MKAIIQRTGKITSLGGNGKKNPAAFDIAKQYGYQPINVLDLENYQDIVWEGIEFNRLFTKDGILYRFNEWFGTYPYDGILLEEIGSVEE